MCAVSAVGDYYSKTSAWPQWPIGVPFPDTQTIVSSIGPSRKEFEALKAQVAEMQRQLEEAKAKDIAEGTPDCEMEDKVIILKKIAALLGADLSKVFPNEKAI
jgi:hypothetical protein